MKAINNKELAEQPQQSTKYFIKVLTHVTRQMSYLEKEYGWVVDQKVLQAFHERHDQLKTVKGTVQSIKKNLR